MLLEDKFGICYNRKRIMRIMRKYNIVCPIRRKSINIKLQRNIKSVKIIFKENLNKMYLEGDVDRYILFTVW